MRQIDQSGGIIYLTSIKPACLPSSATEHLQYHVLWGGPSDHKPCLLALY